MFTSRRALRHPVRHVVEQLESRLCLSSGGIEFDPAWASVLATPKLRKPGSGVDISVTPPDNTPPTGPALSGSFDAITFDQDATNIGFYLIPPDPHGAAGPTQVVNVVNSSIQWYTKAGAMQNNVSLSSFFAPLSPVNSTYDPKVVYDQYNSRFVVLTLEQQDTANGAAANTSRVLMAVSDDSDPNGTWYYGAINSKLTISAVDSWFDYPGLAIGTDAIYVTGNMFGFGASGSFQGSRLWIIPKSPFYAGGAISSAVYDPSTLAALPGQSFTLQPAHMFGSTPGSTGNFLTASGWVSGSTDFVSVIRIDNPLSSPTFTNQFVSLGDVTSTYSPASSPQSGTTINIDSGDGRVYNAVWRNNGLYFGNTVSPVSGVDLGTTTAHWYRIDTTTPGGMVLADQGDVSGEDIAAGTRTFYPAVNVDAAGDMAIGFSASGPSIFPGAYYTARTAAAPAGTLQSSSVLAAGQAFYVRTFTTGSTGRNRWGDYSALALDPSDSTTFWVYNEYAMTQGTTFSGESGRWATRWGKFAIGPTTGSVAGTVYQDRLTNGVKDGSDPALSGVTVYLDANNNGALDAGSSVVPSTDVPKAILDVATINSTLLAPALAGPISDVNVTLNLTHTWDGDLTLTLISPTGTAVILSSALGGSGDNYTNTVFDDSAATAITAGAAPFTGTFRPVNLLSSLNGQSAGGTWTLRIADGAGGDVGTLLSWSLSITTSEVSTITSALGAYSFAALAPGSYNIRQIVPANNVQTLPLGGGAIGQVIAAGDALTGRDFAEFPTVFTGNATNDLWTLESHAGGSLFMIAETIGVAPVVNYQVSSAALGFTPLTFSGNAGDDTLAVKIVSAAGGLPAGGIVFNGGTSTTASPGDKLSIIGSTAPDTIAFNAGVVVVNGGFVNHSGVESFTLDTSGGYDFASFNIGAITLAPAVQTFASFTLSASAFVSLSSGGHNTLETQSIAIDPLATLDLRDNALIVDYTGVAPVSMLRSRLISGRNGYDANIVTQWNGRGIVSSTARANSVAAGFDLYGLGLIANSDLADPSIGRDTYSVFAGRTVDASSLLIKYTYGGDADLNGKVDGDDYALIDNAFNNLIPNFGWLSGDVNFDSNIDGDDYALIDNGFLFQGAPIL